jgi:MerR family transcriptional regulator, redox-sensitive transcriptional activator SoxR
MDEATLTIGQLASRSGFNASAIRYYEEQGVLPEPARTGGQRRYTEEMVRRLGIIDVAKQAGFSLQEVRLLLAAADGGAPANEQLRHLSKRKLPQLGALIERAEAMRRWLTVASSCGCESFEACTLFDDPAAGKSMRDAPTNGGPALQLTHVGPLADNDASCRRVD